jgi:hypothetical protein
MPANAIINFKSIQKKVFASEAYKKKAGQAARRKARNFFIPRKKKFMAKFYAHPVSREVSGGPDASNTSGVIIGEGNLFSFIGFEKGSRPVETLGEFLDSFISMEYVKYDQKLGEWYFRIKLPSQKDVLPVSKIPWQQGASWAFEIEKGIAGIGHYLHTDSVRSRSGGGLQTKKKTRPSAPTRTKYLNQMVKDLRRELRRR